jgi:hypothetical protein
VGAGTSSVGVQGSLVSPSQSVNVEKVEMDVGVGMPLDIISFVRREWESTCYFVIALSRVVS